VSNEIAVSTVLSGLPAHAQRRYRSYAERHNEANVLLAHLRERAEEDIDRRVNVLAAAVATNPDDKRAAAGLRAVQAEADSFQRKRSKIEARRANAEQIGHCLNRFLASIAGGLHDKTLFWSDQKPLPATPGEGESLVEAINRVRSGAQSIATQLAQVRVSPPPPDEIRQMIASALESEVKKFGGFGYSFKRSPPPHDIESLVLVSPDLMGWDNNGRGAVTAWLYKLFPAEVLAVFTANINDNAAGVPRADRSRMIGELEIELIQLELEEVLLVEAAQEQGLDLLPRPNASPLALLGLQPMRASDLAALAQAAE
jgi:hypothetical protein